MRYIGRLRWQLAPECAKVGRGQPNLKHLSRSLQCRQTVAKFETYLCRSNQPRSNANASRYYDLARAELFIKMADSHDRILTASLFLLKRECLALVLGI